MPAYAGTAVIDETPGTTSNGIPALRTPAASSEPVKERVAVEEPDHGAAAFAALHDEPGTDGVAQRLAVLAEQASATSTPAGSSAARTASWRPSATTTSASASSSTARTRQQVGVAGAGADEGDVPSGRLCGRRCVAARLARHALGAVVGDVTALGELQSAARSCSAGRARHDAAQVPSASDRPHPPEQRRGEVAPECRVVDRPVAEAHVDRAVPAGAARSQSSVAVLALDHLGQRAERSGAAGLERGEQRPLGGDGARVAGSSRPAQRRSRRASRRRRASGTRPPARPGRGRAASGAGRAPR